MPKQITYEMTQKDFIADVYALLGDVETEVSQRNATITTRDGYIYGDLLERSLNIPIGHDHTPVNWLRRTVEIHKIQFMGRPFQVISTYDTKDSSTAADEEDKGRIDIENKKQKEYAELRKNLIDDIIRDNGGHALFMDGAESASAVGSWIIKGWYDKDEEKYNLVPIEAVENCYVVWNQDNFRGFDAFGFVNQISKQRAMSLYGVDKTVATSPLGSPLKFATGNVTPPQPSNQPMVTTIEITGKVPGWGSENGVCKRVDHGKENELNATIIGTEIYALKDKENELPRHYIFPNKKQRRRPWGVSDISDAAININATYVETLSDWRTVSSKVNFPKFKGFNFGPDTQMPKYKARKIQILPLAEGQDITFLEQGDANAADFKAQMDEEKEQFVRETGISRVLFDDPSITLNSNQALLTSMKPTSDIAESKKQLWSPILQQMFTDAIEVLANFREDVKDLATDAWNLKVQWPSVMQKEDPVFQQMLLNRKNAGTMSIQSYLEAQGETKEELDRIREEMQDPITAAIQGNQLGLIANMLIAPPQPPPKEEPRVSVSLRGDLTPMQEAEIAQQSGFNTSGEMGPQGISGLQAGEKKDNEGFIGPEGQAIQQSLPAAPAQVATPANNGEGAQPVSQPGSGASSTSPQGALDQAAQQQGA